MQHLHFSEVVFNFRPTIFSLSLVRQFAPFLSKLGPPSFRRKLVELTPNSAVQKVKNMSDVMHQTASQILRQKRAEIIQEVQDGDSPQSSSSRPKDIISILREPSLTVLVRSFLTSNSYF